jgi:predicted HTH transcriptional regulator
MDIDDINNLLEEGEGFRVEFKRRVSTPEKIAKSLIAFANAKGGCILFGIDDDKKIVGVESEKGEIELICAGGMEYCYPPITPEVSVIGYKGKDVVAAIVPESRCKPHRLVRNGDDLNGARMQVYIRVNDKSVLASREVIKILKDERPDSPPVKLMLGENERRLFAYLDSNERITVKQFRKLVNISERRASRTLVKLVRLGVIRIHTMEKEDFYTLAAEL